MQLNRLQFKSRHPYRPIVRYDVFPNALPLPKARVIGKEEQFEQLPLPEVKETEIQTDLKNFSRTRRKRVREFVYTPWEEPA